MNDLNDANKPSKTTSKTIQTRMLSGFLEQQKQPEAKQTNK